MINNRKFCYDIPTEENRNKLIKKLKNKYSFIKTGVVSKSLCKRDIPYIQIGNPKNEVLLSACFHGTEWLTTLLLLHFTDEICDSIEKKRKISEIDIADFFEQKGVLILPCMNPDGVEISIKGPKAALEYCKLVEKVSNNDTTHWQANARGVDLNHNFNADWKGLRNREIRAGILGPAPTRYGGTAPESEPESKAIASLCRFSRIRTAFAFHSQGEEIYWDYGKYTPQRSELMARILAMSSGYIASSPEGLAVGGGFKDWFIKEFKRPAFTIEIGKGENPLPIEDLEDIYKKLEELLVLSIIM